MFGSGCVVRQKPVSPRSQFLQKPQAMLKGRATQSPTFTRSTAVADLDHLAEVLVPEHTAGLEVGAALVHVQVRAADVRARDPHQHVGRLLDLRVRHVLDADLSGPSYTTAFMLPPSSNAFPRDVGLVVHYMQRRGVTGIGSPAHTPDDGGARGVDGDGHRMKPIDVGLVADPHAPTQTELPGATTMAGTC